jgi:hypothetical protein
VARRVHGWARDHEPTELLDRGELVSEVAAGVALDEQLA